MPRLRTIIAIIVALVVLVGGGTFAYFHQQGKATAVAAPKGPTFRSPDGKTTLTVPSGAMAPGTTVNFENGDAKRAADVAKKTLALKSAGTPVNISVTSGSLTSDKVQVTMHYDPRLIPAGLTASQIGLAVFDENFDAWVPILNARVDSKAQTVTGLGPHFSWFDVYVLDPGKKVVHVAGQTIHTVIDATITPVQWFAELVKDLTVQLVKDLLGIAPKLNCDPSDLKVLSSADSLLNRLTACTESTSGSDVRLRMRNGFAFPLRAKKLPDGLKLRLEDIWNDGGDLTTLLRNLFWATQNRVVLSGADLSSVTITDEMQSKAKVSMDIDDDAVAFDVGLAFMVVIMPEGKAAKSAIKPAMQSALKSEKVGAGKLATASAWVGQSYAVMDCIVGASHAGMPPKDILTSAGASWSANVAHDCLSQVLDVAHLKGALIDLLSTLKVIPSTIESILYHAADVAKAEITKTAITPPSASVRRNQIGDIAGHWHVHGVTSFDVNMDGSGSMVWNASGNIYEGHATISFTSLGGGKFLGTFTSTRYTDETGAPTSSPGGDQPRTHATFYVWRHDSHTLQTSDGTGSRPGNPYFCDDYAGAHNATTYALCGA